MRYLIYYLYRYTKSTAAMQTFIELLEAVRNGQRPVVTFRKEIEAGEGYAECGMRARILRASMSESDVCAIVFDFEGFDAHNLPFESANYYDKAGKPTRTAREAGYYRAQENYYFDPTDEVAKHFAIEGEARLQLFDRYKRSGATVSYVAWLEDQVLATRVQTPEAEEAVFG